MEGSGAADELAACGGARKTAIAVAQGAEQRRVDGDVPVQAAEEVREADDAGTSGRCSEQELRSEAMEPGERRQRAPATALSGRKRRRDEEPEAEGTQQAAEHRQSTVLAPTTKTPPTSAVSVAKI